MNQTSMAEIERALYFIPANLPLEDWRRIGAALKDEGLGFEVFEAWSATAEGFNRKECLAWWKGFKTGVIRIGTMFYYAQQYGYTPDKTTAPDYHAIEQRRAEQAKKAAAETKAAALAQAKAAKKCAEIFATAALAGYDHTYLVKKQIPAIGLRTDDKANLLVPILNAHYQIQSLQYIDPTGGKRFHTGAATKGGFFLLGSVVDGLPIRIAEGYAKAALSHCLTGEPVFIAFSKGNIDHVALMVRSQYPNHKIILNADNDHLDANGQPRPEDKNGGLLAATKAAKLINGFVCVPYCSGSDFNNVLSEFGHDETVKQLSVLVNPSLDSPCEPTQEKSITAEISKPCKTCNKPFTPKLKHHVQCISCFIAESKRTKRLDTRNHRVKRINTRFMSDDLLKDGVNIIKATYGTGKTYLSAKYRKSHQEETFLYVAHLISLVEQAAANFDLESYSDHKKTLTEQEWLAICINSIPKLIRDGKVNVFDNVVLDEIEQLLIRMTATGTEEIKNKPLVLSVLKYLIKNAKKLICLDADISNITLDFVEACRPGEQFNIVINGYKHKKRMFIYQDEVSLIDLARTSAGNAEPVLFCTNSIDKSTLIFEQIDTKNKRVINSKTSGTAAVIRFLLNVNLECKADILTTISPSVSTGFSIESGHYKWNLGIFSEKVNTPLDCLQQLERDRVTTDKHVFISNIKRTYTPKRYEQAHDHNMTVINDYGQLVHICPIYSQLVNNVEKLKAELMPDFKGSFIREAMAKGYEIIYVSSIADNEQIARDREEKKVIRERLSEARTTALCEAPKIDGQYYADLKKKSRTTPEEKAMIERREIEEFYGEEITPDLVKTDDKGNRREQIKNARLATMSFSEVKYLQEKSATGRFKEDVNFQTVKRLLYSRLFEYLGITNDLQRTKEIYTFEDVKEFIEYLDESRELFAAIWPEMPPLEKMLNNPYRVISSLLKDLGISQSQKVAKINKKTTCIGYSVNEDDLRRLYFFCLKKKDKNNYNQELAA